MPVWKWKRHVGCSSCARDVARCKKTEGDEAVCLLCFRDASSCLHQADQEASDSLLGIALLPGVINDAATVRETNAQKFHDKLESLQKSTQRSIPDKLSDALANKG